MNADDILAEAAQLGIGLFVVDGRIVAKPKGRTPPELAEKVRANKSELLRLLGVGAETAKHNSTSLPEPSCSDHVGGESNITPAQSILETCTRYGVALRLDADGALVVGKAGAGADEPTPPWPSLLLALEAHANAIADLIRSGWTLRARFAKREVA